MTFAPGAPAPSGPSTRAYVFLSLGVAGLAWSLTVAYLGMRKLQEVNGAYCVVGGPDGAGSGTECEISALVLLMAGILGGPLFGVVAWIGSSRVSRVNPMVIVGTAWAALFGSLGWNFIHPPDGGMLAGWVVSGVVFWLMALGGVAIAVVAYRGSAEGGDETAANIARLRRIPGMREADRADLIGRSTWTWIVLMWTAVGIALGILTGHAFLPDALEGPS